MGMVATGLSVRHPQGEDDRHFDLVNALRLANARIADLEKEMRELSEIVLEMTSSQNQWASQAAEQARRIRERTKGRCPGKNG